MTMQSVRRYLLMNRKIIISSFLCLFVFSQVLFFTYLMSENKRTISLECTSSFTRNVKDERSRFYSGESTLILNRNGEGNFIIEGVTNDESHLNFHYVYFFDYFLTKDGVLKTNLISSESGKRNEVPDDIFQKNFIELNFRLRGGLRINKFRGIYIFSVPGFIISTCAPLKNRIG